MTKIIADSTCDLSKELIENSASLPNSKPNLKISRKTKSSPVSEPLTTDTISVDSISNAQKTQKETKQKRTISFKIKFFLFF